MNELLLADGFNLLVPSSTTRDMNLADLEKLMANYEVAEQARDSFLGGEIEFEEYLNLSERCGINIDQHLEDLEFNFKEIGLI